MNTKLVLPILFLLVTLQAVAAGSVTRSFSQSDVESGEQFTVSLDVDVGQEDYYALEEDYPEGFTLVNAGSGSTEEAGKLKWVVLEGAADTKYNYVLMAPTATAPTEYHFSGSYVFAGETIEHAISGEHMVTVKGGQPAEEKLIIFTSVKLNGEEMLGGKGAELKRNDEMEIEFVLENPSDEDIDAEVTLSIVNSRGNTVHRESVEFDIDDKNEEKESFTLEAEGIGNYTVVLKAMAEDDKGNDYFAEASFPISIGVDADVIDILAEGETRAYIVHGVTFEVNIEHVNKEPIFGPLVQMSINGEDIFLVAGESVFTKEDIEVGVFDIGYDENSGKSTVKFYLIVPENRRPSITHAEPEEYIINIREGESQLFSVEARDPEGQALTYTWHLKSPMSKESVAGTGSSYRFFAEQPGRYFLSIEVSDGVNSDNWRWNINVFPRNLRGDAYEPDNVLLHAKEISVNNVKQQHNFFPEGDVDWVKFEAKEGVTYVIQTSDLDRSVDTVLRLFNQDEEELAYNDDFSSDNDEDWYASRIKYTFKNSGTYYAKAENLMPLVGGAYSIRVYVDSFAMPDTGNLDGSTTDFTAVDIHNVNLVLENSRFGKVTFHESADLSNSFALAQYVTIAQDVIGIDTEQLPALQGKSATLAMRNLDFDEEPDILMNNKPCGDVCSNIHYSSKTGVLTFDVRHFSTFTLAGKSVAKEDVRIDTARMVNEYITKDESIMAQVRVENEGGAKLEDVKITIVVPDLGVRRSVGPVDIASDDTLSRLVETELEYITTPGEYAVRITISNDDIRRVVHRHIVII